VRSIENDGSPYSTMFKGFKRAMAGSSSLVKQLITKIHHHGTPTRARCSTLATRGWLCSSCGMSATSANYRLSNARISGVRLMLRRTPSLVPMMLRTP